MSCATRGTAAPSTCIPADREHRLACATAINCLYCQQELTGACGCSRNTCNEIYDIVTILRRPQLPILRGDRLMLKLLYTSYIYEQQIPSTTYDAGGTKPHRTTPARDAQQIIKQYDKSMCIELRAPECTAAHPQPPCPSPN